MYTTKHNEAEYVNVTITVPIKIWADPAALAEYMVSIAADISRSK